MAVIEVTTFRLVEGADEAGFLAADQRLQHEVSYQQPGLLRRTTARDVDAQRDEWVVIEVWGSAEDADAAAARRTAPVARAFDSLVEPTSITTRRYAGLG